MDDLGDVRIVLLEGRMSSEIAGLVTRHGGRPHSIPAVREVPMACADQVASLMSGLGAEGYSIAVFQTGAGVRMLFAEAERQGRGDELRKALGRLSLVCRGPKPSGALKQQGLAPAVVSREPHTSAELLEAISTLDLDGAGLVLVHHGEHDFALEKALSARGAKIKSLSLYSWMPPEDITALEVLVRDIVEGGVSVVAFTSQIQAHHLFEVAGGLQQGAALAKALQTRTITAAVGPTCAEALQRYGVTPHVVPEHPKMGHMITALSRYLNDHGLAGSALVAGAGTH